MLEPGPLDVRVEVPGIDEASAALVGGGRDQSDERRRARLRDDPDDLSWLDVGADLDDQVGVACEQGAVHGRVGGYGFAPSGGNGTVLPAPPL